MNSYANQCLYNSFSNFQDEILFNDVVNNKQYTYKQIFAQAMQMKADLEARGVKKQDKVIVILENSKTFACLYFAALLGEFVIIPIDPQKGSEEIQDILGMFKAGYLISDKEYGSNQFQFIDYKTLGIEKMHNVLVDFNLLNEIDMKNPYLVTFTSGTTGKSKGVLHTFENLVLSAKAFLNEISLQEKVVFYHHMPMSYIAGILNSIILPFLVGGTIIIGKRFDALIAIKFWDEMMQYKVNLLWLNPTMMNLILKLDRSKQGSAYVRENEITILVGTAKLMPHTRVTFENAYKVKVYESYGLSELLFVATNSKATKEIDTGVGKLLEGVSVKISEQDQEVMVSVPWRFVGYVNDQTANYFKEDYYLTGDIGQEREGILAITDRKKDLIIRGGFNLSPVRMKQILLKEMMGELELVGIEDEILGEKVICFYTSEHTVSKYKLNQHLIGTIGRSYQIDECIQLAKLPTNINGKIDRGALKASYYKRGLPCIKS